MRAVGRKGWGGPGSGSNINPADVVFFDQWIAAGAWTPDGANAGVFETIDLGTPGTDGGIFRTYNFPDSQDDFIYFTTKPPVGWTSAQLQFIAHFIVDETISLPGVYELELNVGIMTDVSDTTPTKTNCDVTYTLADTDIPRYRITATSGTNTVTGATDADGLLLELMRDISVADNESDNLKFVGLNLLFLAP